MPFEIGFIRNTLEAEGFHLESDGPLDNFYNFAVAIREHTIKELQGGPSADIVDELVEALKGLAVHDFGANGWNDSAERYAIKARAALAKLEENK